MSAPGFTEQTVPVEGVGVHVVSGGSGPPVLLLHGFPQTHLGVAARGPGAGRGLPRRVSRPALRGQRQACSAPQPRAVRQARHRRDDD